MAESIPAPRSGVRAVAQGASPGMEFTAQHPALRTCERIGIGRIPLLASPPRSASAAARSLKKGVAEQSRKCREAPADSEAGVVFRMRTKRKTTPAASASVEAARYRACASRVASPLLAVTRGGEYARSEWSLIGPRL